jgi:predicted phosphodiesterase
MRVGLTADAHGNLAGLDAVLAAMGSVDALLYLGDVLGYYFEPAATLRRLRERNAICLLGNHDAYFLDHLGVRPGGDLRVPSREAYRAKYGPALEIAARELTSEEIEWLAALPSRRDLVFDEVRVLAVHGSPWRTVDEYVYPDYPSFERFASLDTDAVVMGHTHRPLVRTEGSVLLVNPGSCGQPRDGDPRAAYAILETQPLSCKPGRAEYDVASLLNRCRAVAPDTPLLTEILERRAKP